MRVLIHNSAGRVINVDVDDDGTVGDLKVAVYDQETLHPIQQLYVFQGVRLDDDEQRLSDAGVSDGTAVHLVLQDIPRDPSEEEE